MSGSVDVQSLGRGIHELLILASLREAPKHGYQIALDVEEGSQGMFVLQHGTLYPILHRLEADGVIRGSWTKAGGRRRKAYALTAAGRRRLEGGTTRIEEVLRGLLGVLRPPEPSPS